jgi:hypothetical protein
MNVNRKEFINQVCVTAACACGFSAIALGGNEETQPEKKSDNSMQKQWLATMLQNMQKDMDKEQLRQIIKQNAVVHYNELNMDAVLAEFQGDLRKFISFLEKKWGWIIAYDEASKTLTANENKSYCVCPLISAANKNSSVLCYCSEGFAERMFSKVTGVPAKATILTSILRGDKQCKYQVVFS